MAGGETMGCARRPSDRYAHLKDFARQGDAARARPFELGSAARAALRLADGALRKATALYPAFAVLLVDDDPAWLHGLRLTLERAAGLSHVLTCQGRRRSRGSWRASPWGWWCWI